MREHVAILAIGVGHLNLAMAPTFLGFDLVLVGMVAEVKRRVLFMLTIDSRSGPGVLDRQYQHQENEQIFFHSAHNITIGTMQQQVSSCHEPLPLLQLHINLLDVDVRGVATLAQLTC